MTYNMTYIIKNIASSSTSARWYINSQLITPNSYQPTPSFILILFLLSVFSFFFLFFFFLFWALKLVLVFTFAFLWCLHVRSCGAAVVFLWVQSHEFLEVFTWGGFGWLRGFVRGILCEGARGDLWGCVRGEEVMVMEMQMQMKLEMVVVVFLYHSLPKII